MQLTWLKIHKFRNVKPGTELHFGPKFNVLLGKNASGKTTLLDLLSAVVDDNVLAYGAKQGDEVDLEYHYSVNNHLFIIRTSSIPETESKISPLALGLGVAKETRAHRGWAVTMLNAKGEPVVICESDGSKGTGRVVGEAEFTFDVSGTELFSRWPSVQSLVYADTRGLSDDLKNTISSLMTSAIVKVLYNASSRFDEALNAYGRMIHAELTLSKGLTCVFMPLQVYRVLTNRLKDDPDGYARALSFPEIPELARVLPLLGFTEGNLRPQLARHTSDNGDSLYEFKDVDFLLSRASGDVIRADLLSFGQKRLLSFFWYLAVRDELPVVADELANGLHHEWIEACVEELLKRQSFLATQNPLLLDYVPPGTPDTTLIHCSTESLDGHETLCWRNFTDEEQARLDAAYKVGIQHVSEILRSEGLW